MHNLPEPVWVEGSLPFKAIKGEAPDVSVCPSSGGAPQLGPPHHCVILALCWVTVCVEGAQAGKEALVKLDKLVFFS